MKRIVYVFTLLACSYTGWSQDQTKRKPDETEVYTPVPPIVRPGEKAGDAPSDAIILFNGKNLDEWVSTNDPSTPAKWTLGDNLFTVKKGTGNIQTKRSFNDYQLHLEWRIP